MTRKAFQPAAFGTGPPVESDFPQCSRSRFELRADGIEFREELKHESVFHKRDVSPALGESE
jgi:hypothetical protein